MNTLLVSLGLGILNSLATQQTPSSSPRYRTATFTVTSPTTIALPGTMMAHPWSHWGEHPNCELGHVQAHLNKWAVKLRVAKLVQPVFHNYDEPLAQMTLLM